MVQPLGSETMEEKHVSHMGSKTMAGTQHDSHMGSQSMEKQPTGSKHSCCKVSSAATGLCGLATLEPSLLGLRRGLGHGLLGLALALVGLAIALLLLTWTGPWQLASWLQPWPWPSGAGSGASPRGAWSHPGAGNPSMGAHTAGKWHSWQPCA